MDIRGADCMREIQIEVFDVKLNFGLEFHQFKLLNLTLNSRLFFPPSFQSKRYILLKFTSVALGSGLRYVLSVGEVLRSVRFTNFPPALAKLE